MKIVIEDNGEITHRERLEIITAYMSVHEMTLGGPGRGMALMKDVVSYVIRVPNFLPVPYRHKYTDYLINVKQRGNTTTFKIAIAKT